jgi:hypothetical protein
VEAGITIIWLKRADVFTKREYGMSSEQRKAIGRRFVEQGINESNEAVFLERLVPDGVTTTRRWGCHRAAWAGT